MDIKEAVYARKSIRGYKPDPVPKEIIAEILETAVRAPSSDNSQPWEIWVLTGEILNNVRRGNVEAMKTRTPGGSSAPYEPVYRKRQVDLAIQLFTLMDIAREDKAKRAAWNERGLRFFDAPVGLILTADKSLRLQTAASDVGGLAQTICLMAASHGLGTCVMGQGIYYHDVIRKYAGIPESKKLFLGLSLGYPDWDFPANKVQSKREPLEVNTTWLGFD